jgi:predicted nuclease of predicted toxin-antitoxin system
MAMAVRENRIVLALDLDFGYLLAVSQSTVPSAALFRVSNERPEAVNARLASVIRLCADDLVAGAIVSVSDTTLRVRRLPI